MNAMVRNLTFNCIIREMRSVRPQDRCRRFFDNRTSVRRCNCFEVDVTINDTNSLDYKISHDLFFSRHSIYIVYHDNHEFQ